MSLKGKNALVTGGSRGIGRAVCIRLAVMGAHVYINYVSNPEAAEETRQTILAAGGTADVLAFNVADPAQAEGAIKKLIHDAGSLDILVNNAGITRDGLMARMKEEDWDTVLDTNLKGSFICAKAASRAMMKKRWGRIVNISSVIGFAGNAGQVNYASAKAGMQGLTKSMAKEFASRNITVNAVAPGYIVTDMTSTLPEEIQEKIKAEIPLACLGKPEDVAGAVAYLVGDDSTYITGQTIHVNGGMYM
ncbi:MAG: 3-oxoacyl-[acyl-carrier-protein] reductase [Proteobacteria bacterium]|nr:3-oxoacyl-[acyl-carrier-protein] reductase [Pseudomonadota bacterium]MBU1137875.1 3-oxoacyl-[acyl-carrier-protein] reductase [Pseudomonadota bacterium]MBU1234501.1 3-oxoacyl-[acyl-carrier-protein] reductase [Pseudomonadota bacterium]MBU1417971.1 3-oxoacyl-[acyl-carrier-protein] reductase [Pseudomonadota bacterium]MBU1453554.1 3-oxoacyl-[acyl-carrier-protein] reductase [Pseudomonadota bacterium]